MKASTVHEGLEGLRWRNGSPSGDGQIGGSGRGDHRGAFRFAKTGMLLFFSFRVMSSPSGAVIGVLIDARRVLEAAALLLQLNATGTLLPRIFFCHGDSDADPAAAPPSQHNHMQPALTPEEARRGTAELLRRFEAGLFERGNRSLYNRAGGGVCTDMVASASRMSAGAAWRL